MLKSFFFLSASLLQPFFPTAMAQHSSVENNFSRFWSENSPLLRNDLSQAGFELSRELPRLDEIRDRQAKVSFDVIHLSAKEKSHAVHCSFEWGRMEDGDLELALTNCQADDPRILSVLHGPQGNQAYSLVMASMKKNSLNLSLSERALAENTGIAHRLQPKIDAGKPTRDRLDWKLERGPVGIQVGDSQDSGYITIRRRKITYRTQF